MNSAETDLGQQRSWNDDWPGTSAEWPASSASRLLDDQATAWIAARFGRRPRESAAVAVLLDEIECRISG